MKEDFGTSVIDGSNLRDIIEDIGKYIDDYLETETSTTEKLINMTNMLINIGEEYLLFNSEQKTYVYRMLFNRIRQWVREGSKGI